ncbi:MAG TPA: hypothetical protein G4O01_03495 [Dehalococcoidia bacterium]|jgi:hypothetical protein|nr:hypothetical protein [Dehalococcoidia bacterium]
MAKEVIKIASPAVKQVKGRRRSLGVFYLLVVMGLVVAIGLSFGANVLAPRMQPEAPEQLGGLELADAYTGAEALEQVNKLHGLDIDLVSALVAVYTRSSPYHGSASATVWVGRAESAEAAAELTQRMADGIGKGGSPFGNLRRVTIDDYEVFQVDGPGGDHFFYNSLKQREAVVWLTIEADNPLPILREALNIF